ncbi:hypothetical protein [Streptomyces sp. NPDC059349]|uniref:hypothetical protein n=1 Tax=Streptomyces sp. NPDC059349 TaxID=3346808 RepID=UPI0036BB69D1
MTCSSLSTSATPPDAATAPPTRATTAWARAVTHSMVSLALPDILLLVFPAAVLGGLSSLPGSILGSVITATLLTLCGYFFGGQWVNVMASVVLLGVLIVRPFGLMGTSSAQRL